jgi:hypothetical protein
VLSDTAEESRTCRRERSWREELKRGTVSGERHTNELDLLMTATCMESNRYRKALTGVKTCKDREWSNTDCQATAAAAAAQQPSLPLNVYIAAAAAAAAALHTWLNIIRQRVGNRAQTVTLMSSQYMLGQWITESFCSVSDGQLLQGPKEHHELHTQ